jgi:hypothetical protein
VAEAAVTAAGDRMKVGELVSALALDCDGGRRVRGALLDKRGQLLLLDLPHGRWCFAKGARVVQDPAAAQKRRKRARGNA